jgi:hypothetical protein
MQATLASACKDMFNENDPEYHRIQAVLNEAVWNDETEIVHTTLTLTLASAAAETHAKLHQQNTRITGI